LSLQINDANAPRSVISTVMMAVFGSTVGGFLWIGRPGLAVLSFLAFLVLGSILTWYGFPTFEAGGWSPALLGQIALAVLSVLIVLIFRESSRPKHWHSRWYFALLAGFLIPSIVTLSIRTFLIQPFSSPSDSMAPTLIVGDRFFVSKMAYGYSKHSLPFSVLDFEGRGFSALPERGDVVVFRGEGADFVKRIVGLPGERIQMAGGALLIDGKAADQQEVGAATAQNDAEGAKLVRETLPNGVSYDTLDLQPDGVLDNTETFLVPEGEYFVLGDNRDNSLDSRTQLGFVPFENLIGRAERIFWNSEGAPYAERQVVRPH
jgi:signal peptidase I